MRRALRAAFDAADPRRKAELTIVLGDEAGDGTDWPDRPGRPERPLLVAAREVPKRSASSPEGRIALLHALAHIELNAIDLALDIVGRFGTGAELDGHHAAFAADWVGVARDEAKHFLLLAERLEALGSAYGGLPAHDGLWQTALKSKDSLLDRLAIAPLVHEARGLDVTPGLINRLREAKDDASAAILDIIYRDEIGHVGVGHKWFCHACAVHGQPPEAALRRGPGPNRVGPATWPVQRIGPPRRRAWPGFRHGLCQEPGGKPKEKGPQLVRPCGASCWDGLL